MPQVDTTRTKVSTQMRCKAFVTGWQDVIKDRGWRNDYDCDPKLQGRYERGRQFAVWAIATHGEAARKMNTFKQGNTVPRSAVVAFLKAHKEGWVL